MALALNLLVLALTLPLDLLVFTLTLALNLLVLALALPLDLLVLALALHALFFLLGLLSGGLGLFVALFALTGLPLLADAALALVLAFGFRFGLARLAFLRMYGGDVRPDEGEDERGKGDPTEW